MKFDAIKGSKMKQATITALVAMLLCLSLVTNQTYAQAPSPGSVPQVVCRDSDGGHKPKDPGVAVLIFFKSNNQLSFDQAWGAYANHTPNVFNGTPKVVTLLDKGGNLSDVVTLPGTSSEPGGPNGPNAITYEASLIEGRCEGKIFKQKAELAHKVDYKTPKFPKSLFPLPPGNTLGGSVIADPSNPTDFVFNVRAAYIVQ